MSKLINIFNKIKHSFRLKEDTSGRVTPTGFEVQSYGAESASKSTELLRESKGWVGACVNSISDEIGAIVLKLYKKTKNGIEEVPDHDVLDLLYRVNDFTSKFDHFWLTQAYLELAGEAPWYLERTGKKIDAIYFLRPDKLRPIVGDDRLISGYKYKIGNTDEIKLGLDEVLFLKYPNPANPFRGLGTLEQAARVVDIDNYAEEWNKRFFENSARPDSILKVKTDQLQQEQLDRLKHTLKDQYQGFNKSHQTMVLFGDYEWQAVNQNAKDMDFIEQQKFTRDKILGIFRVPKAIVSQTEGTNFASAKVAQYVFARWTTRPKMERLIQQLNEFLLPQFPGTENMFLSYVNPVPEDEEVESKIRNEQVKTGIKTINEAREEIDLPEVEGGDSIYIPFNLVPLGERPEEPVTGKNYVELKVKKAEKKSKIYNLDERLREMKARNTTFFEIEKAKDKVREKVKKALWSEYKKQFTKKNEPKKPEKILSHDEKHTFWTVKDKLTDKYIPEVREQMAGQFRSQRKETIPKFNRFKSIKSNSDSLYNAVKLNEKKAINETLKLSLPTLTKLFEESGNETFKLLEVDMAMDITREEIKEKLVENGKRFAGATVKFTNERIKASIATGLAEGKSVDEIQAKVREFFIKSESYRADRIARSEVVRYNVSATEQAFVDSEVVSQKEWFVNPDACPLCEPMAGKKLPLGKSYFKQGDTATGSDGSTIDIDYDTVLGPPLHVNCRCDLVPVFK